MDIYGYEGVQVLSIQVDFATLMQCHLIPGMHIISQDIRPFGLGEMNIMSRLRLAKIQSGYTFISCWSACGQGAEVHYQKG